MLDINRSCLLLKGDDGFSRLIFYDHVYCAQAMMECHALHR